MTSSVISVYFSGPFSSNTLSPRQSNHHYADNDFKCILFNTTMFHIGSNFIEVPICLIGNNPVFSQTKSWCQTCDKSLSEPFMVYYTVARLQCVNWGIFFNEYIKPYMTLVRKHSSNQDKYEIYSSTDFSNEVLINKKSNIILCVQFHQD